MPLCVSCMSGGLSPRIQPSVWNMDLRGGGESSSHPYKALRVSNRRFMRGAATWAAGYRIIRGTLSSDETVLRDDLSLFFLHLVQKQHPRKT